MRLNKILLTLLLMKTITNKIKELELIISEAKKGNITLRTRNGFNAELMQYEECLALFKKLKEILELKEVNND